MSISSIGSSSYYDQYLDNHKLETKKAEVSEKKEELRALDQAVLTPYNHAVQETHQKNEQIQNGN